MSDYVLDFTNNDASFNVELDSETITTYHNEIPGRSANDAHPISAITDLSTNLSTLQSNITAEATARGTADGVLQDNIDAENARAEEAELLIQQNVESEAARATAKETALTSSIQAEVIARTNADNNLQGNITTETTRAEAAEAALQTAVTALDKYFYCTYGTTTYAQIQAAVNAGKIPVCVYNQSGYTGGVYNFYGMTSSACIFTKSYNNTTYYIAVNTSNTWSNNSTTMEIPFQSRYNNRRTVGANQLGRTLICAEDKDGRITPIVLGNTTEATKTACTVPFRPQSIYYFNSTSQLDAGATIAAATLFESIYTTSCLYTFNGSMPAYSTAYLIGTYDKTTGLFTLDSTSTTSYYVFVPNNTASITLSDYFTTGKYYIRIGTSPATANQIQIEMHKPMYYFDGTNLVDGYTAGGVTDVQINGTSITSGGVANIPKAYYNQDGVIRVTPNYGLGIGGTAGNLLYVKEASYAEITNRSNAFNTITPDNLVAAVDSVLCSTSASEALTSEQKANAKARLGAEDKFFYCTYGTTTFQQISDAITAGKIPVCVYDVSSTETNEFFTYAGGNSSYHYLTSVSTSGTTTRYIRVNTSNTWNTNSNSMENPYRLREYNPNYVGSTGVGNNNLVAFDVDNRLIQMTTGNTTATTKVPSTVPFRPDALYYYAGSNKSEGATADSGSMYSHMYTSTVTYMFNETVPAYHHVYLCGTYDKTTGLFTLDNGQTNGVYNKYYKFVPANASGLVLSSYFETGKYYIKIGRSSTSTNTLQVSENKELFYFNGSALVSGREDFHVMDATSFESLPVKSGYYFVY